MIRRILVLSALACAALATGLIASPAGAAPRQDYGGCQATVSDTNPSAGETVHITGTGAGKKVGAFLDEEKADSTPIGTGTSDADGNFAFDAKVPADAAAGAHTILVDCNLADSGTTVKGVTITVGGSTTTLPVTGTSDTMPLTRIALILLAAGGLLLVVSRRRSTKLVRSDV